MQTQRATAAEVSDAMGRSLQNAGNTLSNAATNFFEIHQQKVDADAIANTGPELAKANGVWANRVTSLAQSSRDGGIVQDKDGQSIGMSNQLENEFNEWKTTFLGGIENPKAKLYAQQHVDSLWSSVYESSLRTEAKLGVENRSDKVDQSTADYAKQASTDPASVDASIRSIKTQIANSGLDEHTRYVKAIAAEKTIREAGLMSRVQSDPAAVVSTIETHLNANTEIPETPATTNPDASWNNAINQTLKFEGSKFITNDAGRGANKYGILLSTYFGLKAGEKPTEKQLDTIKNLTEDQAKAFYKDKFWNAIDGDALSKKDPGFAMAAFDTAVNLGVNGAKPLIAQANGDANKLMQLRQAHYDKLVAKNPALYQEHADGWKRRVSALQSASKAATDAASLANKPDTAPTQPVDPVANSLIAGIEPDRLPSFLSAARTEVNRQQAVYRSQITTTEGDHVAAYMNGQDVQKPLSEGDYVKAYGPIEGQQRYANYSAIAQLGNDISSMKLMPPTELDAMVASHDPKDQAGQPGYDLALKRYDALLKARDAVVTSRSSDPIAYAMQNKIAEAATLPFNEPDKLNAALANRAGVAQTMQDKYQTPYTLLTKAEATTLNQGFQKMTTQQKLAYLNTFRTALTNDKAYTSILQQIAPDSPVTAVAGNILSKNSSIDVKHSFTWLPWATQDEHYSPQDVAGTILEGEALINPTKAAQNQDGKGKTFPMPKEEDLRLQFNNVVGKAFAGNPSAADTAYQSVKAYYAGKAARIGDVSGIANPTILKQSITAVLGGVSNVNGKSEVIRPWGMPEDVFTDHAKAAFDKAVADAGLIGNGYRFGLYGLQNAGGDKYLVVSGTNYLHDKQGKPIVLDMTQQAVNRNMTAAPVTTVKPEKSAKPNTTRPKTK
jgi:hypothetical protein